MTELSTQPESTESINPTEVGKLSAFALKGTKSEIAAAHKALASALSAFADTVQVVRVPAGSAGSDHYTPVRAKSGDLIHAAHDDVLRVVRAWNDLRKADVPVRP